GLFRARQGRRRGGTMRHYRRALRASLVAGASVVALLFVTQRPTHAGVPSPGNSSVPTRIVICPAGDSMLVVVARHLSSSPWFEGPIWADVCDCPGFRLSNVAPTCRAPDTSACHVAMMPDPTGTVEIPVS